MLQRMFPDAQFVHLIRDDRDAVSSLTRMPWFDGDIHAAALTWREAVDTGRHLRERLGPGTFYEFRYEDLVAEPEEALVKLCAFLGEEYDPEMTRAYRHARRTVPASRKWHLHTHEAVNTRQVGAWRERMEDWEADLVEHVLASRLVQNGYELTGDRVPRGAARQVPPARGAPLAVAARARRPGAARAGPGAEPGRVAAERSRVPGVTG